MARGKELIEQVASATGLPQDLVTSELNANIKNQGLNPDNISLDQLRLVLAEYLQDVLLSAKAEYSQSS